MTGRRAEEGEAFDREIALIGVLEELTVAALDVLDPRRALSPFLQRVAERFGSRVVLCVEWDATWRVIGSAGLSRASRALPFPALTSPAELAAVALPYFETASAELTRWVVPVATGHLGGQARAAWWLVLLFDAPPRPDQTHRRILERLARTVGVALTQRHLVRLLRERDAELQAFNLRLEQGVTARTRELAAANQELERRMLELHDMQEQLVHVGKMAAVGTLMAGLSHELNNPIAIILGYVQGLLRHPAEPAAQRRALLAIERQAQRCAWLVRSLLDMSSPRPAADGPTVIARLLADVHELAGEPLRQRSVRLELDAPADLPDVTGAQQDIASALLNLVFNALDVSPAGAAIELVARRVDHGDVAGVQVSVRDHGPGIPADVLRRIFEPFFTTKPVGRGTGLGLSLARRIVESQGGTLRAETAPGEGTTMHLWLPAAPA